MSRYEERLSSSPAIRFVWRATVTEAGSFLDVAHDFWVLVFRTRPNRTTVILTGPATEPEPIQYAAGQVNWGIVLQPHIFVPDLPKLGLLNARTVLPLADETAFRLGPHTLPMPTYDTADAFIDDLVQRRILAASQVIADALAGTPPALSPRHLQRHFRQATGLTPRQVQQIQRARYAFVLLQQGLSLAQAAADAGYADQAHMTRSLKLLAGQTPGQIVRAYFGA